MFFGEASLRRAVGAYLQHYHRERPHQGRGNETLDSAPRSTFGKHNEIVRHMPATPHRDVLAATATAQASDAAVTVELAFAFLVLTATRAYSCRHPGFEHSEFSNAANPTDTPAPLTKSTISPYFSPCGRRIRFKRDSSST